MGVHEGSGQLSKAMKELLARWEETRAAWDDPVSRDFDQKHIVPLQIDLRTAATAMGQMSLLIGRIRRDCA
ncbi:MAG TPA: hypothetical protein VLM89_14375 [Phycisphaerae bacterium]|nr:hypothetical protein [Phycisphaerae bacterium]